MELLKRLKGFTPLNFNPFSGGSEKEEKPLTRLELAEIWINGFVWSSIVVIIISLSVFLVWWGFSRSHPKTFTGINYYRSDITVKILDETFELQQFDTFSISTNTGANVEMAIFDELGDTLSTHNFETTVRPGTGIALLAPETDLQLCPVVTDVTEIFYPPKGKDTPQVYLVKELEIAPTVGFASYYEYNNFSPFYKLLSPGTYQGIDLPSSISPSQRVYGVYFFECKNLEDYEKLTEEVLWWTNYSPEVQRSLYDLQQQQLKNTPEYTL